jgi:putative membrane protein
MTVMPSTKLPDNPDSNDLAETRTVLANERTFAGWMRTGMASIALALGLKAVFKDTDHLMLAKGVAEIFIVVAVLIFWASAQKCRQAQNRMKDHDVEAQPHNRMTWLAAILTLGAIATGVILCLL